APPRREAGALRLPEKLTRIGLCDPPEKLFAPDRANVDRSPSLPHPCALGDGEGRPEPGNAGEAVAGKDDRQEERMLVGRKERKCNISPEVRETTGADHPQDLGQPVVRAG